MNDNQKPPQMAAEIDAPGDDRALVDVAEEDWEGAIDVEVSRTDAEAPWTSGIIAVASPIVLWFGIPAVRFR